MDGSLTLYAYESSVNKARGQAKGVSALNSSRLKALDKVLQKLQGKTVLVEGKHDIRALQEIGVQAHFVTTSAKPSKVLEKIQSLSKGEEGKKSESGAILLLDFDREGLRKQKFFKILLEEEGVRANTVFARRLRSLLGFTLIEEIDRKYWDFMQKGEFYGKNVR